MITCTSDKSGIASSGVCSTAYTPAAVTNSVARSTRKTLRTDHSMMRPSMSVPLVHGGGGRKFAGGLRFADRLRRGGRLRSGGRLRRGCLDVNDGVLAAGLAREIEHDA